MAIYKGSTKISGVEIVDNIDDTAASTEKTYSSSKIENSIAMPTGAIISMMGKTAPIGYLVCDGSEYNIADYQTLADYFAEQFGSVSYFGGDGSATFAVPDLRERFLKGSSAGGVNEDAGLPNITGIASGVYINNGSQEFSSGALYGTTNGITRTKNSSGDYNTSDINLDASKSNSIYGNSETVTPANTSVLYCIKY